MRFSRLIPISLLLVVPVFLPSLSRGQAAVKKPQHAARVEAEPPLNEREKAAQLLNRFTFGARPGDLDAGDEGRAAELV